jgi:6-phosphogluconate dehydrogenase
MQVGFIGLGRMGSALVARLAERGHRVVAYDLDPARVRAVARRPTRRVRGVATLGGLVESLRAPRVIWLMVPAGGPLAAVLRGLESYLRAGDLVIDGGNSHYRDSVRHAAALKKEGIAFLDVGVSGGVRGRAGGFCLMAGGDPGAFRRAQPLFRALATRGGYARVGPSGAGHFAKMVHNGIEYGLLQSYGEGFELLADSSYQFDLRELARLWNAGSVVRSWLLELAEAALAKDPRLRGLRGYVADSGEGRWIVEEGVARAVPLPALSLALFARFRSRQKDSLSAKLIAALRREFGGHPVKRR